MSWRSVIPFSSAAAGVVVAFLVVEACTGEEPAATAGGTSGADVPTEAGASEAGGPRELGVFLTSERFGPNFGALADAGDERALIAFVDSQCVAEATAAKLPHAQDYRAIIAVSPTGDAGADVSRLLATQATELPDDRWCVIGTAGNGRGPDCGGVINVVFDGPESFYVGPKNPLFTNELGAQTSLDHRFLSGLRLDGDMPIIGNCGGWHNTLARLPQDAPLDLDGGFRMGLGIVDRTDGGPLAWATYDEPCFDDVRLPFLCVEQPPPP